MTAVRERYRLDLIELQATCEANYARLMRLLPDMRGLVLGILSETSDNSGPWPMVWHEANAS